jgi:hypothetical protein
MIKNDKKMISKKNVLQSESPMNVVSIVVEMPF